MFLFSAITVAQEVVPKPNEQMPSETQQPPNKRKKGLDSFITVGSTLSPKSEYKTSFLGSNTSSTKSDKGALTFGVDTAFKIGENISLCLLLDSTDYVYSSGGANDNLLFIGLAPRFERKLENSDSFIWISLGIGLLRNRMGDQQDIDSGLIVSLDNTAANTVGISPRLGLDLSMNENLFLRFQYAYTYGEFAYDFNVKNYPALTNVGDGTLKLSRAWSALSIGLAWAY